MIPAAQHDPLTADLMVNKLLVQGIDMQQAAKAFIRRERDDLCRRVVRGLDGAAEDGADPVSAGQHFLPR